MSENNKTKRIPLLRDINEGAVNEGANWKNGNLDEDFYNFYASADVLSASLGHFMDDMQSNKNDDAYYSLKVAYDEIEEVEKYIKSQKEKIRKELEDNNKL